MEVETVDLWTGATTPARTYHRKITTPVTQADLRAVTWTGKEGQEIGLPTPDEALIITGSTERYALRDGTRGVMYCGEQAFLLLVTWHNRDNLSAGMLAAPAGLVFYG